MIYFDVHGVMTEAGIICSQEDSDVVARSQLIMDHMQRRASLDMAYFCQALDDTGQHHIVQQFFQTPTNDSQISLATEEADNE